GVTYYVSDCGPGADIDCVTGNDGNDGLTPETAWQTYDKAQDMFAYLESGDEIRFAKGASFTVVGSNLWANNNTAGANPIIVSDYAPTWGSGDEGKPYINQTSNAPVFNMLNTNSISLLDGNWIFSNLSLHCDSNVNSSSGITYGMDVDDLVIDNMTIDGCYIGIHSMTWGSCEVGNSACNGINDRITIRNSTLIDNRRAGFFGHGSEFVLENNTFTNNGFLEEQFGHHIYLAGIAEGRVSGNEMYQSALNSSGVCQGGALVAHGTIDGLLIENNTVYEDIGKVAGNCWGISFTTGYSQAESFTDVIIRDNTITNVGNVFITAQSC
ncbi:MAG: hypothetical protein GY808_13370, partial [Gammaproteobacteria bacterium]|nr:hypothetical protein [Gammaproteobacteria bacterium]